MSVSARVREVISRLGMSQVDFAARVSLESTKLSKSLSGARRFTSLELAKIAEEANVTVDWLLGDVSTFAVAPRGVGNLVAPSLLQTLQELAVRRTDLAGLGYPPALKLPDAKVLRSVRGSGGALAQWARAKLGEYRTDLAAAIESAFGIDVGVCSLGPGFDGAAVRTDYARMIVLAPKSIAGRFRFTLAHELGHVLAGDGEDFHIDSGTGQGFTRASPVETQANAFAAELLMSEEAVRAKFEHGVGEVEFLRYAVELGVSPSALAWRMRNLGIVGDDDARRLSMFTCAVAAQAGECLDLYHRDQRVSSQLRVPQLLLNDYWQAYSAGDVTLRPIASLLGVTTDVLRDEQNDWQRWI